MTTGQRIQQARKNAGLSQKQLGEKLGLSASMIGQWENDLRKPKIETIRRIADAIGIYFLDLLSKEERAIYDSGVKEGTEGEEWLNDMIDDLWKREGYSYSDIEVRLINSFSKLNDLGQQKAVENVEIIAGNPQFQNQEMLLAEEPTIEEIDWWTLAQDTPDAPPPSQEATATAPAEPPPETPEKDG